MVLASVSSRWARLSASGSGARAASSLARAATWRPRAARRLRIARGLLRALDRRGQRIEVAETAGLLRELRLALDARDLLIDARETIAMGPHAGFELIAFGGEVGQHAGQFGEGGLGRGQRRFSLRAAFIDTAARLDARPDFVLELRIFDVEPLQCDVGIGGLPLLAIDV